ncbi:hypothetical protein SAMN04490244_104124 [Tranquillimonas rosea]|uniref:Uncharacterized protein n=1 Tax=Tranquillimonas rosea TaxID=641238 RepID=A0A1H9TFJ6_9RHOB|nr:hypothetical protein [Tranquillimonas rosea]SER95383.1 hypothetical protein SAMN04490244_104124 [Tranquillimonas rosea]
MDGFVIQSQHAEASAESGSRNVTWLAIAESEADALELVPGSNRTIIERGMHVLEEARARGVPTGGAMILE